ALKPLFSQLIEEGMRPNLAVEVLYDGQPIYWDQPIGIPLDDRYAVERPILLGDRAFTLRLIPTRDYVHNQLGFISLVLLLGGLIVGILLS
ncbi:hypothetical protein ACO1LX_19555, partial [Staphylococcus aureus]